MKNFIIILICLILGYVIYFLVWRYNSFLIGPSQFKYSDCKVKYKQEYINSSSMFYPYNRWLEDSAKSVFAKCLCEKYASIRDENIKNYIESLYYEDVWYQENFNRYVNRFDTSIFVKYKDRIFKKEPKILDAINKYKNNTEVLYEIIRDRFKNSYDIRLEYYNVIYSLPAGKVPIDTLIKYKEIIFKTPPHYGDA